MNYSQRLLSRTVRSMFPTPTHITLSIINCFTGMQVLPAKARIMDDQGHIGRSHVFAQKCTAHTRYISRVPMPRISCRKYTEGYRRSRDIDRPDSEKVSVAVNYDSASLYKSQQIVEQQSSLVN
ncbi:hypothetical protein ACS0PU_004887 [Formica fusca]